MADITLISGSTLGSAEYVSEHLESLLQQNDFTTTLLHGPELDEVTPENLWLVVTSTHGAGDLPDNLQPFYDDLQTKRPDLSAVRYGAIGIGSSEYDTFCGAISDDAADAAADATISVKQLEEMLAQPLLNRTGRGVTLTLHGERLLGHARTLLRQHDAAVRTAEELRPYSGRFAGLDNGTLLTGPVDDALAAVAEATGDHRRAADYRRAAAELTDRLRAAAQALLG